MSSGSVRDEVCWADQKNCWDQDSKSRHWGLEENWERVAILFLSQLALQHKELLNTKLLSVSDNRFKLDRPSGEKNLST